MDSIRGMDRDLFWPRKSLAKKLPATGRCLAFLLHLMADNHKTQSKQIEDKGVFFWFGDDLHVNSPANTIRWLEQGLLDLIKGAAGYRSSSNIRITDEKRR